MYTGLFPSLTPCPLPAGIRDFDAFSANMTVVAGMLYATQCVTTRVGFAGSGASGSSTIKAKLFAVAGAPDHASGGETLAPSHVYFGGIGVFAANAVDDRFNNADMGRNVVVSAPAFALAAREVSAVDDFDFPQAIAQARSATARRLRVDICVILSNGVGSIGHYLVKRFTKRVQLTAMLSC
jgi:hypothetical protein